MEKFTMVKSNVIFPDELPWALYLVMGKYDCYWVEGFNAGDRYLSRTSPSYIKHLTEGDALVMSDKNNWKIIAERRVSETDVWRGEGLPPVGSKVVFIDPDNQMYGAGDGEIVEILAHHDYTTDIRVAAYRFKHGELSFGVAQAPACYFKPVQEKTEEDIIIEDIERLVDVGYDPLVTATEIYNKYIKQETK